VKARKIISTFLDFGAYIKEKYHFWISPKQKMLSQVNYVWKEWLVIHSNIRTYVQQAI